MPSMRKPAATPVETEAKVPVSSFVAIKRRIREAGGRRLSPRTLETNTLFDSPGGSLRSAGKSFRVRRYGGVGTVTLKGVARVEGGLKSRVEFETEVASPEMLARILISLGFVPTFRYEKFREIWKVGKTLVCLDETPLGRMLEIEGPAGAIHRLAPRLGLGPERFLSASYPALWFEAGRTGDMVFPSPSSRVKKRA
jgi:adenylate cyclase class 2